jgi:hypothetical protein
VGCARAQYMLALSVKATVAFFLNECCFLLFTIINPGGLDLVKSSALDSDYFVRVLLLLLRFCVIIIHCALN